MTTDEAIAIIRNALWHAEQTGHLDATGAYGALQSLSASLCALGVERDDWRRRHSEMVKFATEERLNREKEDRYSAMGHIEGESAYKEEA